MQLRQIISISHPNGFSGSEHTHAHHEMVYCFEGSGSIFIRGKKTNFSTGNYYLTRGKTLHAEKDDRACRIIYFLFDAPEEMICEGAYTDYSGNVGSLVKRLYEEAGGELAQKEKMIELLISQLLLEARRASLPTSEQQDFSRILQYINENLEQSTDFRQMAAQYHYSYDRFRHLFKARVGCSPHQYVLRQRVERAKFLLSLKANDSLTKIAFDCGFVSSSQFSNVFFAKTGMTPTQYKKQLTDS
ncbi:MAG: helix-turn-helix domain-containing protein [Clostridia bacterium]|nr:helix-turn-helix domain-containing protein [Clostridia bacterium]